MKKSFKDLSSLKIQIAPTERKQPTIKTLSERKNDVDQRILEESADAHEYMARMLGGKSSAPNTKGKAFSHQQPTSHTPQKSPSSPTESTETAKEEISALKKKCAEAEEQIRILTLSNNELKGRIRSLEKSAEENDNKIRSLEGQAGQKSSTVQNLEKKNRDLKDELQALKEQAEKTLRSSRLLIRPEMDNLFENEIEEHLYETLAEALKQAENAGRNRHADILCEILKSNPVSGSLAEKREAIANIFSETSRIGDREIRAMEELGFKLITGKNHYKFKMGAYAVTVSKTPSDWRSSSNLKAEIYSRFF